MSKVPGGPQDYGPPLAAPPSYSQAVGGVPPSSPFTPQQPSMNPYFPTNQAPFVSPQVNATQYPVTYACPNGGTQTVPPFTKDPFHTINLNATSPRYQYATTGTHVVPGPQIVTTVVPLGKEPTHMVCPYCHAEVDTSTKTEPGLIAYLSGALICLLGCWAGCCLIPCCIDDCMDVHHRCPNCQTYLGRFRR